MIYRISIAGIIVVALLVSGCTSGTSDNPLQPQHILSANIMEPGRNIWGYFNFIVDPFMDDPVTIMPVRQTTFHANIRQYLEEYPCVNCLSTSNFAVTPTGFTLDIKIKHPFAANSGIYGFDVRGIFFFSGSRDFPMMKIMASSPSAGDAYIVNPDGYTALFNPVDYLGTGVYSYTRGKLVWGWMQDPNTNLGAFVAFFSDGQSEADGGRRAFFPGDSVTRMVEFVTPISKPICFGYAIDSSYDNPAKVPPFSPNDFPVSANCSEPYRIEVVSSKNTLTPETGSASLHVIVWDHHGPHGISACYAEAPGLTDEIIIDDTPEISDSGNITFDLVVPNSLGSASILGEEILIRIDHDESDPVFGVVPAYQLHILKVHELKLNPKIESIFPNQGKANTTVSVVIKGEGFQDNPKIELYLGLLKIPAIDPVVIDPYTIETAFELNGPYGLYTLYVQNPDGKWSELPDAFLIIP